MEKYQEYKEMGNGSIEQKRLNFFQRLVGIIVSPASTMQDLIEKPRILFPLFSAAFGLLIFYLLRYDLYVDLVRDSILRALENDPSFSSQQIEGFIVPSAIIGLVAAAFVEIITWIVTGAIIFGVCKFFKGEGKFKQYLSIVGYCYVIVLLYYTLSILVSFLNGKMYIDASVANITNLFAAHLQGSFIYGIIKGIDFFTIWYYIVLAKGIILLSNLSKTKVYTLCGVIFIIELLIRANELRYM